MSRISVVLAAALLMAGAVIGANYLQNKLHPELPILEGLGGDFSLPSTTGQSLQLSELYGKVVLLNFGFTSCPDVCPTALSRMRKALDLLENNADIQPLFVTIDPERDSLEKLSDYLPYFHPAIIGLRGDSSQLQKVAALYKVLYQKQVMDSALEYGFLHNDHIYLLDQQGHVRAMYSGSVTPEHMATQISSLL